MSSGQPPAPAAKTEDTKPPAFDEKLSRAEAEAAHVALSTPRMVMEAVKAASNHGVVTTISATNGALVLQQPHSAAVDAQGNIYVADHEAYVVRKIAAGTGAQSVVGGVVGRKYTRPRKTLTPAATAAAADGKDSKAGDAKAADAKAAATATTTTAATASASTASSGGSTAAAGSSGGDAKSKDFKAPAAKGPMILPPELRGRPVVRDGKVIFVDEPRPRPTPSAPAKPLTYDGPVGDALFHSPYGVVVDSKGNLFVTDCAEHKVRKIANGQVTTFAGSGEKGCANGKALEATFSTPYGLAIDDKDNLYVCDADNERIRKITPDGDVTTFCGTGERGAKNGKATEATFSFPCGCATDRDGSLYIADCGNHVIRKVDGASMEVTTFAGCGREGWEDGLALDSRFQFPGGVVVDAYGAVIVADSAGHKVRRVAPMVSLATLRACLTEAIPKEILRLINSYCPEVITTTLAGTNTPGRTDGAGTAAAFNWIYHVAIEKSDLESGATSLIVSDKTNNLLRRLTYKF